MLFGYIDFPRESCLSAAQIVWPPCSALYRFAYYISLQSFDAPKKPLVKKIEEIVEEKELYVIC